MRRSVGPAALALSCLAACHSGRYVGSISPSGRFANRGFGIALPLEQLGLERDWRVLTASDRDQSARAPQLRETQVDLNGDGALAVAERIRFSDPLLRFISRTSTAVHIDIRVEMVPAWKRRTPLRALLDDGNEKVSAPHKGERHERITATGLRLLTHVATGERPANRALRTIYVDHPAMPTRGRGVRRQLIRVELYAPKLSTALAQAQDAIAENLWLESPGHSPRAGRRPQEQAP